MSYKRFTKEKSTTKNTKIVYNENGFAIMSKELVDMLLQDHNRLWELENQIENGTLIELPCKVGDKVWLIYENQVEFAEIWRIYLTPTYNEFKWLIPYDETQPKDTGSFKTNEIGKTVFLTKAEAEKKLEELSKNP